MAGDRSSCWCLLTKRPLEKIHNEVSIWSMKKTKVGGS